MKIQIKKNKSGSTPRGVAWSCELWLDSVHAATAENHGDGGATIVQWHNARLQREFRAHAKANPLTDKTSFGPITHNGEGAEWDGRYIDALACRELLKKSRR
jgi:hypothetical protein